jgi:hypothetical protein
MPPAGNAAYTHSWALRVIDLNNYVPVCQGFDVDNIPILMHPVVAILPEGNGWVSGHFIWQKQGVKICRKYPLPVYECDRAIMIAMVRQS